MQCAEKTKDIINIQSGAALVRNDRRRLSGIAPLDDFLNGGLPSGISEWGMPPGHSERTLLLHFMAASRPLTLWVYSPALSVYPPAWAAHGVDLKRVRFVSCATPMQTLKPLFLRKVFSLMIFDAPEKLSVADCAFLSHRARMQQQSIVIIRPYRLSNQRGNVWAQMRLNCTRNTRGDLELVGLRGTQPQKYILTQPSLIGAGKE